MEVHTSTFHSVYISTFGKTRSLDAEIPLHSTLFILVPFTTTIGTWKTNSTFHSVYISTNSARMLLDRQIHTLHSTLFILVRNCVTDSTIPVVSLHSTLFILVQLKFHKQMQPQESLHSTLFILVRQGDRTNSNVVFISTFHSVYISTDYANSLFRKRSDLYIPLCLY